MNGCHSVEPQTIRKHCHLIIFGKIRKKLFLWCNYYTYSCYVLLILGGAGTFVKGLSHNSVNKGFLFDDVPITILSHQNWDFLDVPSLETKQNKCSY